MKERKNKYGLIPKERCTQKCMFVVFGMPNAGKPSMISCLAGRRTAVTGFSFRPAYGPQWIIPEDMFLRDMPSAVQSGEGEQSLARRGAPDATKILKAGQKTAEVIKRASWCGSSAFRFCGVRPGDAESVLVLMVKKRGLSGKGQGPNIREAAKLPIRDYQKGRFVG